LDGLLKILLPDVSRSQEQPRHPLPDTPALRDKAVSQAANMHSYNATSLCASLDEAAQASPSRTENQQSHRARFWDCDGPIIHYKRCEGDEMCFT
jgi:hypothetical protein